MLFFTHLLRLGQMILAPLRKPSGIPSALSALLTSFGADRLQSVPAFLSFASGICFQSSAKSSEKHVALQSVRHTLFFIVLFISAPSAFAALPDGTLVRAEGASSVFLVEEGKARWVESAEAFVQHGFKWDAIQDVSREELSVHPSGERIGVNSKVIFSDEYTSLPDLIPFPAHDVRLADRQGRVILKFSSTYWNAGGGALELRGDSAARTGVGDEETNVLQHIVRKDGTARDKVVGKFLWHGAHSHYHFANFAQYRFAALGSLAQPAIQEKATRCIWDTIAVALHLPGAPQKKGYASCSNPDSQGISVGWGDVYEYTLADQYLDVHDLAPGKYLLTFDVDPLANFVEQNKANNISMALIELDVARRYVKRLWAAAPFVTSATSFPDGTLIQSEKDDRTYVVRNNRKRLLHTSGLMAKYAGAGKEVYTFPQSIMDAIPHNNLIRAGGQTVYALNDLGYKRHIRNPAIFSSYKLRWEDIADVDAEELAAYADARLVQVAGQEDVYYIAGDTLRRIASPEAFLTHNFSWDEVQIINETDFATYSHGPDIFGFEKLP